MNTAAQSGSNTAYNNQCYEHTANSEHYQKAHGDWLVVQTSLSGPQQSEVLLRIVQ